MKHVLENMHLRCDCGEVFNAPFCPVCEAPALGRDHYSPRFDGVDAIAAAEERDARRTDRKRFKDGHRPDLVEIFDADEIL